MVELPNLTRLTRWQHFSWQHFQSKTDSRLLSYLFEHFLIKIFSKIFIQKHGTKRSLSKKYFQVRFLGLVIFDLVRPFCLKHRHYGTFVAHEFEASTKILRNK